MTVVSGKLHADTASLDGRGLCGATWSITMSIWTTQSGGEARLLTLDEALLLFVREILEGLLLRLLDEQSGEHARQHEKGEYLQPESFRELD